MIKGVGLRPIPFSDRDYSLGWSLSKLYPYNKCLMMYYLEKMPIDWLAFPKKKRMEIEELRGLSSYAIEVGSVIHETLAVYFRHCQAQKDLNDEELIQIGIDTFERNIEGKKVHEGRISPNDREENIEVAERRVQELLEAFIQLPERPQMAEAVRQRPDDVFIDHGEKIRSYGEFRIDGFKGYGSPDLVYLDKDGMYNVISWKTGNHDSDNFLVQLAAQVLFCEHSLGLSPEKITGRTINLNHLDEEPIELMGDSELLEQCLERMKRDVEELKLLYTDKTCKVPKKKETFTFTQNPLTCTKCKYIDVCERPN